jgi:ankyrin repeat protein
MSWDPSISRIINVPFEAGDLVEFTRLLRAHPEYLRHVDGTDLWMWRAAMGGQLPFVQALVDLGLDVNVPKDREDPDDPYSCPEGPILQAASEGHLNVVRWLLDHGAKINYVVQGKPRCLPLMRAAGNGHIDVVKLLVEHGADVHATWKGVNALTHAYNYGQQSVSDYLRSLS